MKKIISIIISIAMCAMLASCGGVKNEVSDTEQPTLIDTTDCGCRLCYRLVISVFADEYDGQCVTATQQDNFHSASCPRYDQCRKTSK